MDDKAILATELCEATEAEVKFLLMSLRNVKEQRRKKANGDLRCVALMRDGGIQDRYIETKMRDSTK